MTVEAIGLCIRDSGRLDQQRVEGVRHVQAGRRDALGRGPAADLVDRPGGAGDDRLPGPVVAGDDHVLSGGQLGGPLRGRRQAGHRAAAVAGLCHHPAADRGEAHHLLLAHRPGPVQRGQLAQAVPDGGVGPDAEAVQHAQGGQRAGDDPRLGHLGGDLVAAGGRGERAERLLRRGEAAPDGADGAAAGALAREEVDDPGGGPGPGEEDPLAGRERLPCPGVEQGEQPFEGAGGVVRGGGDDGGADRAAGEPVGQRAGQVRQFGLGELRHEVEQPGHLGPERGRVRAVQQQQFGVLPAGDQPGGALVERLPPGAAGRLGDRDVGVDPAEAHGRHAGPDRLVGRPEFRLARHVHGGLVAEQSGVRVDVAGRRGDHLVVHGEGGLDQPGDARRGLGVPEVALDRAERGRGGRRVGGAACGGQRLDLGRVAEGRAGAVALEVRDGLDAVARPPVGAGQSEPVAARLRPGDAAPAVRGDSPAADARVDPPPLGQRVPLAHQHQHAGALAGPEAVGVLVVDLHLAGGQCAGLGEADHLERVDREVHPAGDGHVQLAVGQGLGGRDDGQQGGGAGAVDRVPAAAQVEVVADPAGDGVGQAAGQRVLVDGREGGLVLGLQFGQERGGVLLGPALAGQRGGHRAADVRPPQPHDVGPREFPGEAVSDHDAGGLVGQSRTVRESGVGECLVGDVEGQPVGQVGRPVGASGDAVLDPVERVVPEDGGLRRVVAVGCATVRRPVVRLVHPLVRQPPEGPSAAQDVLPQFARRIGIRVSEADSHDSDPLTAHVFTARGDELTSNLFADPTDLHWSRVPPGPSECLLRVCFPPGPGARFLHNGVISSGRYSITSLFDNAVI